MHIKAHKIPTGFCVESLSCVQEEIGVQYYRLERKASHKKQTRTYIAKPFIS